MHVYAVDSAWKCDAKYFPSNKRVNVLQIVVCSQSFIVNARKELAVCLLKTYLRSIRTTEENTGLYFVGPILLYKRGLNRLLAEFLK